MKGNHEWIRSSNSGSAPENDSEPQNDSVQENIVSGPLPGDVATGRKIGRIEKWYKNKKAGIKTKIRDAASSPDALAHAESWGSLFKRDSELWSVRGPTVKTLLPIVVDILQAKIGLSDINVADKLKKLTDNAGTFEQTIIGMI